MPLKSLALWSQNCYTWWHKEEYNYNCVGSQYDNVYQMVNVNAFCETKELSMFQLGLEAFYRAHMYVLNSTLKNVLFEFFLTNLVVTGILSFNSCSPFEIILFQSAMKGMLWNLGEGNSSRHWLQLHSIRCLWQWPRYHLQEKQHGWLSKAAKQALVFSIQMKQSDAFAHKWCKTEDFTCNLGWFDTSLHCHITLAFDAGSRQARFPQNS